MARKINDAGFDLIREFEGLRLSAYQDTVGVWTIGYGSTAGVKRGQRITEEAAERLLREDLAIAEAGVASAITEELTDNQFAACVSLAFNVGVGAFRKSSIAKYINAGDVSLAADRFLLYNKAGGKTVAGLTRRRKAERKLFLADAPELNGTTDPAEPTVTETVVTKTTETEKPTAGGIQKTVKEAITTVASNESVKTIASEGVSKLATKATTALTTGSTATATGGAVTGKTWLYVLSIVLAVGAVAVVLFLLWHKSSKEKRIAVINSDRDRVDVEFE